MCVKYWQKNLLDYMVVFSTSTRIPRAELPRSIAPLYIAVSMSPLRYCISSSSSPLEVVNVSGGCAKGGGWLAALWFGRGQQLPIKVELGSSLCSMPQMVRPFGYLESKGQCT